MTCHTNPPPLTSLTLRQALTGNHITLTIIVLPSFKHSYQLCHPVIINKQRINNNDDDDNDDDTRSLLLFLTSYRLEELAYTRSGDKGNSCNVGVVARHPSLYPYLQKALSAAAVGDYFSHVWGPELGPDAPLECVKRYVFVCMDNR